MALRWEADIAQPNHFETLRKDMHVAKVRAELAAEGGGEGNGQEPRTRLEDQQRVLASDVASTGLHPTDRQRRAMVERTSKLRRKIVAWIDVQSRFFPGLKNISADRRGSVGSPSSEMMLWLPSAIAVAREDKDVVPAVRDGVRRGQHRQNDIRARVQAARGQAEEALHEVRRLLLVRTHDKIAALNGQVQRAAEQYRATRVALVALGELKSDDVRGLPQATFHDPERKKTTKGKRKKKKQRVERETSWIWVTQGARYNPGDGAAMHEAVRIEWAKVRARCHRWREEVDLLEAEMARVRTYLAWRAEWWKGQVGQRPALADAQLEGETVFALRQAAIQTQLADGFADDWKSLPDLGDSDEEESDEEEAAIGTLPQREIKTTYVDKVLEM
ncbi:hypothetical protein B0H14DRAFT_3516879 [Mycena olivaceomarginata]|nr:hypothetical protein B0H14DRAFT_3516879 [Mycena olivaceomarginata]